MRQLLEIKLVVLQFFTILCLTEVQEISPSCCRTRPVPGPGKYDYDKDFDVNVTEFITGKGYPAETHCVATADGYILSMQRIPYGRLCSQEQQKRVIFLLHGQYSAATQWVLNFPDQSLGFILADDCWDVWMGNTRGTTYSRQHKYLSPEDIEFWDFSFDEIAKYDIPAMIDYILDATGEQKLYFIGHSQGVTAAFALLSESPEYNNKIKILIGYAPAIFFRHTKGILPVIAPLTPLGHIALYTFGISELFPSNAATKLFARYVCGTEGIKFCEFLIAVGLGRDCQQLNQTRTAVYVAEAPAGSSFKSTLHFGQLINSKQFRKYDYYERNYLYYNQTSPPEYNLGNITTPVGLFVGMNDFIATPEDSEILKRKLKSLISYKLVSYRCLNHIDFVIAIDAWRLIYYDTLQLLNRYE